MIEKISTETGEKKPVSFVEQKVIDDLAAGKNGGRALLPRLFDDFGDPVTHEFMILHRAHQYTSGIYSPRCLLALFGRNGCYVR